MRKNTSAAQPNRGIQREERLILKHCLFFILNNFIQK